MDQWHVSITRLPGIGLISIAASNQIIHLSSEITPLTSRHQPIFTAIIKMPLITINTNNYTADDNSQIFQISLS